MGSFHGMSSATETIIDYLRDAESQEQASISLLEGHLRGAPPGPYRSAARRHLDETRRHAHQVGERRGDLGATRGPIGTLLTIGEAVAGRVVGLAAAPLNLFVSRTRADAMLRNAEDAIAAEAREVATYEALERLAEEAGDGATASLARAIRGDEERYLDELREQLPALTDRVVRERIGVRVRETPRREEPQPEPEPEREAPARPAGQTNGGPVHTERETPYHDKAERLRAARREAPKTPDGPSPAQAARVRHTETDDVVESEGAGEPGAEVHVAEPWEGYRSMKAGEVVRRLKEEDAATRALVRLYESQTKKRKSILAATEA